MTTAAFCEIEPYCRAVLAKHWPGVPIYEDIRTLSADTLRRDGIAVDAICGGFPCQDLSHAGKRAGLEGERSGLWGEYRRLIGEIRPRFVIVENVPGLLSLGMGTVLGDISALGYDAVWDCVPASALGACHRRDRVWIIASNTDCGGSERLQHQLAVFGECGPGGADHEAHRDKPAPDTMRVGSSGPEGAIEPCHSAANQHRQVNRTEHVLGWPTEPAVRRRDDGVSRGLDRPRLKALGNAVVPQVVEIIGRAIMQAEAA